MESKKGTIIKTARDNMPDGINCVETTLCTVTVPTFANFNNAIIATRGMLIKIIPT
ncbi:unnamed protein product [marine sediment metagenome]|uniref:Uncharacterized protein n=1 Tax=marine sediment metagenome TaxID=412755 RepID=X0XTW5_9ZZZZ